MTDCIKRGHISTRLPKDAVEVVMKVATRKENNVVYAGYGYTAFVPEVGFVTNGGARSKEYKKVWYDCMKDILDCVPKKSTVLIHARYWNFVTAFVCDHPLPNDTEKERKWREKVISLCEKKEIRLFMHFLRGECDETEKMAGKIAAKKMNEEYEKNLEK